MKLVDRDGNEITSKENKEAQQLEQQLAQKAHSLLEPLIRKLQLANQQISQDQLMQISSMAHQMLFNRMIFNLVKKTGVNDLSELIAEDDVEELKTSFNNQFKFSQSGQEPPEA